MRKLLPFARSCKCNELVESFIFLRKATIYCKPYRKKIITFLTPFSFTGEGLFDPEDIASGCEEWDHTLKKTRIFLPSAWFDRTSRRFTLHLTLWCCASEQSEVNQNQPYRNLEVRCSEEAMKTVDGLPSRIRRGSLNFLLFLCDDWAWSWFGVPKRMRVDCSCKMQ